MKENNEEKKFDIAKEYKTINAISDFFIARTYLINIKTSMENSEQKEGQYPCVENVKEQIKKGLNGIEDILKPNENKNENENNINNENKNNNENDVNQNKGQMTMENLKTSVKNGNFFQYKVQLNNNENQKQISSNDVSQIYNNYGNKLIHNLKYEDLRNELSALNNEISKLNIDLKNDKLNASEKQKLISELTKLNNIKKNFVTMMNTWLSNDESLKAINENKQELQANIKLLKENTKFQKAYDDLNQKDKKDNEDKKNKEVKKLSEISDDELIKFLNEKSNDIGKDISSENGATEAQANNLIDSIKTLNKKIKENEEELSEDLKKINDMIKNNSSDVSKETTNDYLAEQFMENNNFNQNKFNDEFFKDVLLGNTSDDKNIQNQILFRDMIKESSTDMDNESGFLSSVDIKKIGAIFLNAFDENENQDEFDKIFKDQKEIDQVINNLEGLSQDPDYKKFIQKILSNKDLSILLQDTANKLVNKFKNKKYEELPWYKKIVSPLKYIGYQWRNHKAATILKTLGVVGIGGGITAAAFFAPAFLVASIKLAIVIVAIYTIVKLIKHVVNKIKNRGKDPEQVQESEKNSTYYANKLYTMATAFGLNYDSLKELAEKTTEEPKLSNSEKKALNNSLKSTKNMYETYHNSLLKSGKYNISGDNQNKQRAIIKFQAKNNKENNIIPKNKSVHLPLKIAKDLGYNVSQNNKDDQIKD